MTIGRKQRVDKNVFEGREGINPRPLVSICIPAYNSASYLRTCLNSIVAQTYDNLEVIIADDGSSDQSIEIAAEYADKYGFKLHRNVKNLGAAKTSSDLVEMAAGEYVALYHSDDVYEKTIVEDSVAILNSDKSIGIVGTMANIIDERGDHLAEFRLHEVLKMLHKKMYDFDDTMLGTLKNGGHDIFLVTPSVMAKKQVYQEVGAFDTGKYRSAYDYEMWLRIATRYNVAVIDKKLMSYRIHKNQISELQIRKNIEVQDIVWAVRDYRQYIRNTRLKKYCGRLLDTWFFRTAKKQNYLHFYDKSNDTLRLIESKKYVLLKLLLKTFNSMHIPLKRNYRRI